MNKVESIDMAKAKFKAGLDEINSGLNKIKDAECLFLDDPWYGDFILILESRIRILQTAAEHELDIHKAMMLDSLTE